MELDEKHEQYETKCKTHTLFEIVDRNPHAYPHNGKARFTYGSHLSSKTAQTAFRNKTPNYCTGS